MTLCSIMAYIYYYASSKKKVRNLFMPFYDIHKLNTMAYTIMMALLLWHTVSMKSFFQKNAINNIHQYCYLYGNTRLSTHICLYSLLLTLFTLWACVFIFTQAHHTNALYISNSRPFYVAAFVCFDVGLRATLSGCIGFENGVYTYFEQRTAPYIAYTHRRQQQRRYTNTRTVELWKNTEILWKISL